MTDYLSSSNSPCNYEMAKENRKKSPRKESLVHTLRPSLAAPFTGTLGISRHWQVGIGRPRQGSLLGLPSVIMRHCKTLAQSSTLLSRRVCNPFTQAHHRVSKLKQKMCNEGRSLSRQAPSQYAWRRGTRIKPQKDPGLVPWGSLVARAVMDTALIFPLPLSLQGNTAFQRASNQGEPRG